MGVNLTRAVSRGGKMPRSLSVLIQSAVPALQKTATFAVPVLLGLGLIALAGLAPAAGVHDALHDIRHVAGFPCH